MRARSALLLLFWNAVIFLVVVVVLEAVFGTWITGDPLKNLNVFRNIEWRLPADHLYRQPDAIIYRRDRWGFRGKFDTPADIDILAIGGSTTDQRFISEGRTWVDALADCLIAKGQPTHVANAGVTGQSSIGHALNFDLWFSQIPDLKPRYVLAYVGINEIWANSDSAAIKNDVRTFNEAATPASPWSIWFHHIKLKSALYRVYKIAKGQWTAFNAGVGYQFFGRDDTSPRAADAFARGFINEKTLINGAAYARLSGNIRKTHQTRLELYKRNLGHLVDKIKSTDAIPVLVTQRWASYREDGRWVHGKASDRALQEAYNQITREVCRARDLPCIDLAQGLRFDPGDTYDIVHATPAGSRKVGTFICERMFPIMQGRR